MLENILDEQYLLIFIKYMMDLNVIIHICISLFIISPIIYPLKWIKRGAFVIPLLWCIYWFIFDGCHLTKYTYTNEENPSFIHKLLLLINDNITRKQSDNLIQVVMVCIPTILCYRLIRNC